MIEAHGPAIRFGLFIGMLAVMLVWELAAPYRPPSVSKLKRWLINLGLTIFNTAILQLVFAGAILTAARYVTLHRIGVLNAVDLAPWVKTLATLVFMDFMLYVWHLLNHEMPLLWRFHRVHHSDKNMDASTATRFHIGELALSAIIKISLVYFIGADAVGVFVFESALVLCAQFQHSSLKAPRVFEKWFWVLFVPPSMHRIHHSVKIRERNSNYGTVFSLWDRLGGTLVADTDQGRLVIGLGGHFDENKLDFLQLLVMPFTRPVK